MLSLLPNRYIPVESLYENRLKKKKKRFIKQFEKQKYDLFFPFDLSVNMVYKEPERCDQFSRLQANLEVSRCSNY